MSELTIILAFVIGAVVAFIIANLMNKNKNVPKAELEALQKSLDSANQEKAQLSSYKQQLEDTKKELNTVRESFSRSEEDKNIAQTNLANSNAKIEELEKKHKSLEDNNNQLQNDILSLKEENAKHQANAESAKNELNEKNTKLSEFERTTKTLNTQLREKVDELATAKSNLESTKSLLDDKNEKYDALFKFNSDQTEELNSVKNENSEYKAKYDALNEKLETQLKDFNTLRQSAELSFKNIAQQILDNSSNQLKETSKESLEAILKPYSEKMADLKQTVSEAYEKEARGFASFDERMKSLLEQTNVVSIQANNLASALKGDHRLQGSWGEATLEQILEVSGLTKGTHYYSQSTHKDENDKNIRPDFEINLPDNRKIIIDSKVSLNAYEAAYNATNNVEREKKLEEHIKAIKNHIDKLSSKNYNQIKNAFNFVFMFIPIEPAYQAALQKEPGLHRYAAEKKILLVSTTTLLVSLRLVKDMWLLDAQNRNVKNIIDKVNDVYEKLVNFLENYLKIGTQLSKVTGIYNEATKQLSSGRGNAIKRLTELKKLGIPSEKQIPEELQSFEDDYVVINSEVLEDSDESKLLEATQQMSKSVLQEEEMGNDATE